MRKVPLVLFALASLALGAPGASLGHPPGTHLHCVTTPNGKIHAIAGGVTMHSHHDTAFHNFHSKVHIGPGAPLISGTDFSEPYSCG